MEGSVHYVLVHGACHRAWCWHKLKPLLESAGHRVTALDLAASGTNPTSIQHVNTLTEYSAPLLEFLSSLPPNEKVILVGHSFGGLSLALAMDKFPEKVAVGVFLAAFLPDTKHPPSYTIQELQKKATSEAFLDTKIEISGSKTSFLFGPKFIPDNLHQLCDIEDIELGKMLVRPGSLYVEELSLANKFSEEGYGSVQRVYIVCEKDKTIPEEFQIWMVQNAGVKDVIAMEDTDHMAMLCKPKQLCTYLLEIGNKYLKYVFKNSIM